MPTRRLKDKTRSTTRKAPRPSRGRSFRAAHAKRRRNPATTNIIQAGHCVKFEGEDSYRDVIAVHSSDFDVEKAHPLATYGNTAASMCTIDEWNNAVYRIEMETQIGDSYWTKEHARNWDDGTVDKILGLMNMSPLNKNEFFGKKIVEAYPMRSLDLLRKEREDAAAAYERTRRDEYSAPHKNDVDIAHRWEEPTELEFETEDYRTTVDMLPAGFEIKVGGNYTFKSRFHQDAEPIHVNVTSIVTTEPQPREDGLYYENHDNSSISGRKFNRELHPTSLQGQDIVNSVMVCGILLVGHNVQGKKGGYAVVANNNYICIGETPIEVMRLANEQIEDANLYGHALISVGDIVEFISPIDEVYGILVVTIFYGEDEEEIQTIRSDNLDECRVYGEVLYKDSSKVHPKERKTISLGRPDIGARLSVPNKWNFVRVLPGEIPASAFYRGRAADLDKKEESRHDAKFANGDYIILKVDNPDNSSEPYYVSGKIDLIVEKCLRREDEIEWDDRYEYEDVAEEHILEFNERHRTKDPLFLKIYLYLDKVTYNERAKKEGWEYGDRLNFSSRQASIVTDYDEINQIPWVDYNEPLLLELDSEHQDWEDAYREVAPLIQGSYVVFKLMNAPIDEGFFSGYVVSMGFGYNDGDLFEYDSELEKMERDLWNNRDDENLHMKLLLDETDNFAKKYFGMAGRIDHRGRVKITAKDTMLVDKMEYKNIRDLEID